MILTWFWHFQTTVKLRKSWYKYYIFLSSKFTVPKLDNFISNSKSYYFIIKTKSYNFIIKTRSYNSIIKTIVLLLCDISRFRLSWLGRLVSCSQRFFKVIWLFNFSILRVPDEDYSKNAPCALNLISTFFIANTKILS